MHMPAELALSLFWAKKALAVTLLPPLGPMLLVLLGLWRSRAQRQRGRGLIWLGLALMLVFSTPASVGWMLHRLETEPPVRSEDLARAEAIVILAGGQRRYAPEYGGSSVSALSLERLRYGARLARASGLPVMVSGGRVDDPQPEAELMRTALEEDFGVAVRWTETASRDTAENARNCALLLRRDGIGRIALVTHAVHMPRARSAFERSGLEVIAAPTAWQAGPFEGFEADDLVPTPRAAHAGWYAAHEWLGRLAYRLMDR